MNPFKRQKFASLPPEVVAKWPMTVVDEGYTPFPKKLMRTLHQVLPLGEVGEELSALLAVVDFRRTKLLRLPSAAYLAFIAGLEEDAFVNALQRLKNRGYVEFSGNREGVDVNLDGFYSTVTRVAAHQDEQLQSGGDFGMEAL